MKYQKLLISLSVFLLSSITASAATKYEKPEIFMFSGKILDHTYSFNFSTEFEIVTDNESHHRLVSKEKDEYKTIVDIREFSGKTYDEIINYYKTPENKFLKVEEIQPNLNTIGKKAYFTNGESDSELVIFKRGNAKLAMNYTSDETLNEKFLTIVNSVNFKDDWFSYKDSSNGYSLIFPKNSLTEITAKGFKAKDLSTKRTSIKISIHEKQDIKSALSSDQEQNYIKVIDAKNVLGTDEELIANANIDGESFFRIYARFSNIIYVVDINGDLNNETFFEILNGIQFIEIDKTKVNYLYFSDIENNGINTEAINYLKERGIINGYKDGTYKPDTPVNRAELTKLVIALNTVPQASKYKACFSDVNSEWFAPYICYAKNLGWIQGYEDQTFRPDQPVNRAEAVKIVLNSIFNKKSFTASSSLFLDVSAKDWFYDYITFANKNGLLDKQHVTGNKLGMIYGPAEPMTRKEVAELIYRSLKYLNLK